MSDEPFLIATIGESSLFARADDEAKPTVPVPGKRDQILTLRAPAAAIRQDARWSARQVINAIWVGYKKMWIFGSQFTSDETALADMAKLLVEAADRADNNKPAMLRVWEKDNANKRTAVLLVNVFKTEEDSK
jgi:hypothetical protein